MSEEPPFDAGFDVGGVETSVEAQEVPVYEVTIRYKNRPNEELRCNYIDVNGIVVRFSDAKESEKVGNMMGGVHVGIRQEPLKIVNIEGVVDLDIDLVDSELFHPDDDGVGEGDVEE